QQVDKWAILPAQPGGVTAPLLALAYHELGEYKLFLYNAQTGEPVRQFSGHLNMVTWLAFSGDGRLLASAGDDQTVCVWRLTDLPQVMGIKADLRGIGVREQRTTGDMRVITVNPFEVLPANAGKLVPEDVLLGVVVEGKLTPFPRGKGITETFQAKGLKASD